MPNDDLAETLAAIGQASMAPMAGAIAAQQVLNCAQAIDTFLGAALKAHQLQRAATDEFSRERFRILEENCISRAERLFSSLKPSPE